MIFLKSLHVKRRLSVRNNRKLCEHVMYSALQNEFDFQLNLTKRKVFCAALIVMSAWSYCVKAGTAPKRNAMMI